MYIRISLFIFIFLFVPVSGFSDFEKAVNFAEKGQTEKAYEIIRNNKFSKEQKAFVYFKSGESLFLKKDYKKALFYFQKAEGFEEKQNLTWNKGLCYYGLKNYKKASFYLSRHLDKKNSENEILTAARAFYLNKDYEKALEVLDIKEFEKKIEEKSLLKINIYFTSKDYEKSLNLSQNLFKKNPENRKYLEYIVKTKKKLGKNNQYDKYMLMLINQNCKSLFSFLNNRNAFLLSGFYLDHFCKDSKIYEAALSFYKNAHYTKSLEVIEKSKEKNYKLSLLKGKIYFINGEFEKAGNIFLNALEYGENTTELFFYAGEAFFMSDMHEKAAKCFKSVVQKDSPYFKEAEKMLEIIEN
ncbi:MAG: tetratricopeptide repeat protein [Thermodesulfobacteriota bacterium]